MIDHAASTRFTQRTMAWVLVGGMVIMFLKFIAWYLTGSTAILTDALESCINVVAAAFALYSLKLAAKPRDKDHPYGHGKVEFFAAGFEGAMIIVAGIFISIEGTRGMIQGKEIHKIDLGLILTIIGGLANMFMGLWLIRNGKNHHSLTLTADGKHLLSDTLSSVGLAIGLILMLILPLPWLDGAVALVLAIVILVTGFRLVKDSIAGLMDEVDFGVIEEVLAALNRNRNPKWIDIHNMRIQKYGKYLHVDCHVTLPWYNSLEDTHVEVSGIEKMLNHELGDRVEIFIHSDPCLPISCSICSIHDCAERKHPFVKTIPWTIDNITSNEKHTAVK